MSNQKPDDKLTKAGVGMMKFGGSMILMGCSLMVLLPVIVILVIMLFF